MLPRFTTQRTHTRADGYAPAVLRGAEQEGERAIGERKGGGRGVFRVSSASALTQERGARDLERGGSTQRQQIVRVHQGERGERLTPNMKRVPQVCGLAIASADPVTQILMSCC